MSEVKNIPEGWKSTDIGNLVDLAQGVAINAKTNYVLSDKENGIPLLKINNLLNNTIDQYANPKLVPKQTIIHLNDVIFTRTGQVGEVLTNKYGILHNNSFKVIPSDKVHWKYLYWYLKNEKVYNYVQKVAAGSVQKDLNHSAFKTIEFNYPENKEEQKSIADILNAFDNKIKLLQSQNKTLEESAQTIFAECFGKYQIADEVPDGWRAGKINEFVGSTLGGDYGKEEIEDDFNQSTLCLRGTDLPDMKMGIPEKAPIRYLKKSKLDKCKLINGDIVIEISGGTETQSTGRVMYINDVILKNSKLPITCVNFCRIIRPLHIKYSYFLHSLFDYLYNRKVFFNWENGTTGIKNLNLNAFLEGFELIVPNDENEILEFNKLVKSSFIKIQSNNIQIQILKEANNELLPRLMSGEIRINEFKV